jgi:choline dehydrogenase
MSSGYWPLTGPKRPVATSAARTIIILGALLALALLAVLLLSILLPLFVNKPCTTRCGDLTIGCDELCVTDLIIGGGTAGLSLANRLSANTSHNVLVIEAGDNFINEPLVSDPIDGLFFEDLYLIEPSRFHFQIQTALQSSGYQMTFNGGRLLGGSSSINDCAMFRGTPRFWDELDAATGGTGRFASEHVNQIFKEMEWLKASDVYVPDATRGQTENAVKIEVIPRILNTSDDAHLMGELFANALGYSWPHTVGANDPAATVGAFPQFDMLYDFNATSNPIVRWSGQKAYLNDTVVDQDTLAGVEGRKIKVLVRSTVQRILFHPLDATKAVGVEYLDSKGVQRKAWATSNVVVSAFMHTAPILQRSGVGPAAVLEAANIEPHVINEHVGQNWAYHTYIPIIFLNPALSGVSNPADAPLISGFGTVFLEDPVLAPEPDRRGFQPITVSFPFIMAYFNFQLVPASRGTINVYSDDPSQVAKMDPRIFSDPNDIISWRTHMRNTVSALQTYDPSVFCLSIDNTTLYDDNLFEGWLFANMNYLNSLAHSYGTARLSDSSTTGAIDPEFRVFGAKNLRVCDTQAFPTQTDGNPAYAAMALGQLCADAIMQRPVPAKKRKASSTIAKSPKKRVPKPPKNVHHNKRDGMTQQDYQNIVAFFTSVKTKFSAAEAQRIISGIKATSTWRELKAQYEPYQGK